MGAVTHILLPLPALGSIPELPTQFFSPIQKPAPEELLRCGRAFFLCSFGYGGLFFDFLYAVSPLLFFFVESWYIVLEGVNVNETNMQVCVGRRRPNLY